MVKICACLKNGFGDQLLAIAFGLNAAENLKVPLYIIDDILYTCNNFTFTSSLPKYLYVKNAEYRKVSDMIGISNINNSQDIRRKYFKKVLVNNYLLLGNEKYFNSQQFYDTFFTKNFTYPFQLMTLKKYCKFKIDSFSFDEKLKDFVGIQLRFRNKDFYKTDEYIFQVIDYLNNVKNENLYVTYDNQVAFDDANIKIDKSNNVIYYTDNSQDIDWTNKFNNRDEYEVGQYDALQLALNLAMCKSFIGTYSSNFSRFVVPLMKSSIIFQFNKVI